MLKHNNPVASDGIRPSRLRIQTGADNLREYGRFEAKVKHFP
jgi:hypothetical protein